VRERAERQARRYFLLALASERRALLDPMVVAVGGVIGSGKSTLSEGLGLQLGGPVVASDPVRKHLLEVDEGTSLADSPFRGAYAARTSERVYDQLLRNARAVVESGRPVVLDASFRSRHHRQQARELARSLGVPFRFVECRTDREVCRARLTARRKGSHVSDGRPELLDAFADSWEDVDELPGSEYVAVDTSGPVADGLVALAEELPVWPERL
jgi:predicted kinase